MLRWVCAGHNTDGEVLCAVGGVHINAVGPGTPRIPCCHLGQAHSLNFVPPMRSLLCACLVATDHLRELGTHQVLGSRCLWAVVTATGLVPLTMVGFTRELRWCWWPVPFGGVILLVGFARVSNEPGVLSQRSTTPAFGQGSYAVLMGCLMPRTSVGQIA